MNGTKPDNKAKFYLHSIEVSKLWGYRDINLKFHDDINILVGRNGSGKTTVLNIIADILLLDLDALSKIRFEKILLRFHSSDQKNIPFIVISKIKSSDKPPVEGFDIKAYNDIKSKKAAAEQRAMYEIRHQSPSQLGGLAGLYTPYRALEPVKSNIASFISDLSTVTWISVHRKSVSSRDLKAGNYDSSVDQRIDMINKNFSDFIAEIDSKISAETKGFQTRLLTSLLLNPPKRDLNVSRITPKKLDELRDVVSFILTDLVEIDLYSSRIDDLFENASEALDRMKGEQPQLELGDILTISHMLQIERIADDWTEFVHKTAELNLHRHAISAAFDSFFIDKSSAILQNGRIFFYNNSVKKEFLTLMTPNELSSGEKQLYIFLMEALLQNKRPSIFIADEPELSLHVLWQEKLVSAMRNLNSKAQIIFATHSPDLVGPYSKSIFDLDPSIQQGVISIDSVINNSDV